MFIEIIQKFAETKPLFLLAAVSFLKDQSIKENWAVNFDDVPGDNFPYALMNR